MDTTEPIFHLAVRAHWDEAVTSGGRYRRSTVDKSLDEEGFIHCSFAHQVANTAERHYAGRNDILLLTIDPAKVGAEIKVENGFPHIYGPLPIDAVREVRPYP